MLPLTTSGKWTEGPVAIFYLVVGSMGPVAGANQSLFREKHRKKWVLRNRRKSGKLGHGFYLLDDREKKKMILTMEEIGMCDRYTYSPSVV